MSEGNKWSDDDFLSTLESLEPLTNQDHLFMAADAQTNACLNRFHKEWGLYAMGFKEAADLLVNHVEEGGISQDFLVYPVGFLYRHYLELAMKDLIRLGRELQYIDEPVPRTHNIQRLWGICRQVLLSAFPDDPTEELDEIERLIDELSRGDPKSTAFRYPEETSGSLSLPGIDLINLSGLRQTVHKISLTLEGSCSALEEALQYKREIESYHGSEP
ncbi:hypothetical protein ACFL2Q_06425 [Thermodesulfobacteriota bacterium]